MGGESIRGRVYDRFVLHEAVFRICCRRIDAVREEIVRQRTALERYIAGHPRFRSALTPVDVSDRAPRVARRMADAARRVGVGPMAAVAGAMAEMAAEAGLAAGAPEAIVDNGGDVFLRVTRPVLVAVYAGNNSVGGRLALRVEPSDTPLAVCSSSGRMGPSFSMGDCDLATVVARDAALADAAATHAANLVRSVDDLAPALSAVMKIAGVAGVLLVKSDRIGLAGRLPRLVRSPIE
jgi:ApbE superfamily uncharacterized protein (UPF0280 family)